MRKARSCAYVLARAIRLRPPLRALHRAVILPLTPVATLPVTSRCRPRLCTRVIFRFGDSRVGERGPWSGGSGGVEVPGPESSLYATSSEETNSEVLPSASVA